jgi:hypothetical protein
MGNGLIPRDFGGFVEVNIDGTIYRLRRYLGWYDRERLAQLSTAVTLMLYGRVKINDTEVPITDAARVPLAFESLVDVRLHKLLAYLDSWSHLDEDLKPLPITAETVKRLDQRHSKILLERINQLDEEQAGPDKESPLPVNSDASSMAPSSRDEQGSS